VALLFAVACGSDPASDQAVTPAEAPVQPTPEPTPVESGVDEPAASADPAQVESSVDDPAASGDPTPVQSGELTPTPDSRPIDTAVFDTLVAGGFDEVEATCMARALTLGRMVETDPTDLLPVFAACNVDPARLVELGAGPASER